MKIKVVPPVSNMKLNFSALKIQIRGRLGRRLYFRKKIGYSQILEVNTLV